MLKNIPTKELAKFLGKTPGFASQIKTGASKLPPGSCIAVSKEFNIPLHELRPDIYPAPEDEPIRQNEELNQPNQTKRPLRHPGRRRSDDRRGVNN